MGFTVLVDRWSAQNVFDQSSAKAGGHRSRSWSSRLHYKCPRLDLQIDNKEHQTLKTTKNHAKPNESIIIDVICIYIYIYHKLYINIYSCILNQACTRPTPKKSHSAISFPPCHTWTPNLYLSWHSWWSRPLLESEANAKRPSRSSFIVTFTKPRQIWHLLESFGPNLSFSEFQVEKTIDHHTTTTTLSHVLAARATWISYSFAALAPQFPV